MRFTFEELVFGILALFALYFVVIVVIFFISLALEFGPLVSLGIFLLVIGVLYIAAIIGKIIVKYM